MKWDFSRQLTWKWDTFWFDAFQLVCRITGSSHSNVFRIDNNMTHIRYKYIHAFMQSLSSAVDITFCACACDAKVFTLFCILYSVFVCFIAYCWVKMLFNLSHVWMCVCKMCKSKCQFRRPIPKLKQKHRLSARIRARNGILSAFVCCVEIENLNWCFVLTDSNFSIGKLRFSISDLSMWFKSF